MEVLTWLFESSCPKDSGFSQASHLLLRRCLNFLSGLLYASANVIDSIVNSPSRAFHRSAGTSARDNSQRQDAHCQNYFHVRRIKPPHG